MSKAANGLYKLTMYLRPDQYVWLRALALEEAMEREGGRPDVSALLRDMIDKVRPEIDAIVEKRRPPRRRKKR